LLINAVSVVEVRPTGEADTAASWDALTVAAHSDLELTDASTQTRRTTPPSDVAKFAKKTAAEFGPHETALRVCKFIFDSVKYQHGVTGVNSIATEAWSAKVGVCQDFAHLALGALRSVGIPARYVSGYLHPKLEPEIGDRAVSESHAWIEWFAGEWFGYDPTNDTAITQRHIVVGHGRDYDDVPPLRGVYSADCTSELFVSVHITRTA
jgi:transglutaminase-like putative cysteine protease